MRALHRMFHEDRSPQRPLYVGSVKTNVGHLEGASGIVSIIKSAMMLERGYVLPNYDFREGNPEIPFDEWGVKVPARLVHMEPTVFEEPTEGLGLRRLGTCSSPQGASIS